MADLPAASANTMLDTVFTGTQWISLHTADPGTTGANEGTDGRQSTTWAAASGGSKASNAGQTWASAVGGQTYTHFGVWSASSAGTFKGGGPLAASITPPAASQIVIASGGITLTDS